jgi:flagellar biosynthetic protein FliQ
MELMLEHLGHGLMLSLLLSMPCVLTAAGIGLVVGILQAVTQVQEQTIAAAPKILGVFLLILLGGGFMLNSLTDYVRESFQIAFNEIPQDGVFILPPKASRSAGQMRARAFFQEQAKNPKSDKLKEFATHWPETAPDKGTAAVTMTTRKPGSGNALGLAEKMALTKTQH